MPSIHQMRVDISNVYPYSLSPKWKDKVMNLLPDNQILAMYRSFEGQGRFSESEKKRKHDLKRDGIQLRMDI
jgi:hypothetical protein